MVNNIKECRPNRIMQILSTRLLYNRKEEKKTNLLFFCEQNSARIFQKAKKNLPPLSPSSEETTCFSFPIIYPVRSYMVPTPPSGLALSNLTSTSPPPPLRTTHEGIYWRRGGDENLAPTNPWAINKIAQAPTKLYIMYTSKGGLEKQTYWLSIFVSKDIWKKNWIEKWTFTGIFYWSEWKK